MNKDPHHWIRQQAQMQQAAIQRNQLADLQNSNLGYNQAGFGDYRPQQPPEEPNKQLLLLIEE